MTSGQAHHAPDQIKILFLQGKRLTVFNIHQYHMDLTLLLMKMRSQRDTAPSLYTCEFQNRGDDHGGDHGDDRGDGRHLHPLHLLCNRVVSMSQNF